jgi:large subunit ribosomal protein L21
MFAVVRTGGKQYRVAPGDKIAVEKLAGDAGDTITLGDVLLAGDGGDIKDAAKVTVSAEIIAQAKSEKVTVFKKRRRHNYRRKAGHRQQMTLLRIVAVGDHKAEKKAAPDAKQARSANKEATPKVEEAPKATATSHEAERQEPAKGVDVKKETKAKKAAPVKDGAGSKPADDKSAATKAPKAAAAKKPAAKKPAAKK